MTVLARAYKVSPSELTSLAIDTMGQDPTWAILFTRTATQIVRHHVASQAELSTTIWGHLFNEGRELRWREDAGHTSAVLLGSDLEGAPPSEHADLRLSVEATIDLSLWGQFDGRGWTTTRFRPDALGYDIDEINGNPPERGSELALTAEVLIDSDLRPAFHRYRQLQIVEER